LLVGRAGGPGVNDFSSYAGRAWQTGVSGKVYFKGGSGRGRTTVILLEDPVIGSFEPDFSRSLIF
jgi:hypothetical protein